MAYPALTSKAKRSAIGSPLDLVMVKDNKLINGWSNRERERERVLFIMTFSIIMKVKSWLLKSGQVYGYQITVTHKSDS